jgi:hypothetical protein
LFGQFVQFRGWQRKYMGISFGETQTELSLEAIEGESRRWRFAQMTRPNSDDLVDAFVVEQVRDTARCDEDSHPVSNNKRVRMIDLKTLTTVQFYGKNAERSEILKRAERLVEIVSRHDSFSS